jgi:hypothetical protein
MAMTLKDLMLCSFVPIYQITCHYIPQDTSFHETIISKIGIYFIYITLESFHDIYNTKHFIIH